MRQYPDFWGNGYATELIEVIFKAKSERTYISAYDVSVLRSQNFDSYSPVQGQFLLRDSKLYLTLSRGYNGLSVPFTTEIITENRPAGNLRFEGPISGPRLLGADVTSLTYIKNFLILTEEGKLIAIDFQI
jgi:hypothetical protein